MHHHLEAQQALIKGQRPVEVGHLQVNVADARAGGHTIRREGKRLGHSWRRGKKSDRK